MKTIGLIGGMSWQSTAQYYALINEGVAARVGPAHSASILMLSVDFAEIQALQHHGDWDALAARMADAGRALQAGGADCIAVCTNTMHKLADAITDAADLPLLHIADAAGAAIAAAGMKRVGLLGTAFTMEQDFYRGRLAERFGLDVIVPGAEDRATVHRIIYDELCRGAIRDESRAAYRQVIARLVADGAEGVILGCTEIMLLVGADDSAVPLFDTTALHAAAAVDFALAE